MLMFVGVLLSIEDIIAHESMVYPEEERIPKEELIALREERL